MNYATKEQLALISRIERLSSEIDVAYELIKELEDTRKHLVAELSSNGNVGDIQPDKARCFNVVTCECLSCLKEFTYASTSLSVCETCPACYEKQSGQESHMLIIRSE